MAGQALEIAHELGAPSISGIVYAAFNSYAAPQSQAQRSRVVEILSRPALGFLLALVPIVAAGGFWLARRRPR